MDLTKLVILGLATWRISHMIALEEGPGNILARFRRFAGLHYNQWSQPVYHTSLAKGLSCVWCNSIWVGAFWAILYAWQPQAAVLVAAPFALSAICIFLEDFVSFSKVE